MTPGVKYDGEKPRWDLLPVGPVKEIVWVLTVALKKYDAHNWQKVPEAKRRYYAAALRHLTTWWEGEKSDPETGLSHLAHAGACVLFLLWFDQLETHPSDPTASVYYKGSTKSGT